MSAATLLADHRPSVAALTDRDKAYCDVFTTALEGGIGYWSTCSRYHWSVAGDEETQALDFIAVITDVEDEAQPTYVIDRNVIARGIRLAYRRGNWATYHARALSDLNFGKWDDADFDSDTADIVVQFGLFGEYTYA